VPLQTSIPRSNPLLFSSCAPFTISRVAQIHQGHPVPRQGALWPHDAQVRLPTPAPARRSFPPAFVLTRPLRYCRFTVYIKQAPLDAKADAPAIVATPASAASPRALPLLNTSAYKKHVRFNARRHLFFATRAGIHVALSGSCARSAKEGARFERRDVGRSKSDPFLTRVLLSYQRLQGVAETENRRGGLGSGLGWSDTCAVQRCCIALCGSRLQRPNASAAPMTQSETNRKQQLVRTEIGSVLSLWDP
jgi:hypothetical protein